MFLCAISFISLIPAEEDIRYVFYLEDSAGNVLLCTFVAEFLLE